MPARRERSQDVERGLSFPRFRADQPSKSGAKSVLRAGSRRAGIAAASPTAAAASPRHNAASGSAAKGSVCAIALR